MLDSVDMVSGTFLVNALTFLFFVLFVVRVTNRQGWKRQVRKQWVLSTLWLSLLCVGAVCVYFNYKDAREMIFKDVLTDEAVLQLRSDIDAGVPVDITDDNGMTPLMHCVYCDSVPNVRFLLHRGANPDVENNFGQSARDIAIERKNPGVTALFR